jgi:hypothetical protein
MTIFLHEISENADAIMIKSYYSDSNSKNKLIAQKKTIKIRAGKRERQNDFLIVFTASECTEPLKPEKIVCTKICRVNLVF